MVLPAAALIILAAAVFIIALFAITDWFEIFAIIVGVVAIIYFAGYPIMG